MAKAIRLFATIFLAWLLVLSTEEMGPRGAEARDCGAPSSKFKGMCFSDRNCGSVCETEGFSGGSCQGVRRRCICTKPCYN